MLQRHNTYTHDFDAESKGLRFRSWLGREKDKDNAFVEELASLGFSASGDKEMGEQRPKTKRDHENSLVPPKFGGRLMRLFLMP